MKCLLLIVLGVAVSLGDESQVLHDFSQGNLQFSSDIYKELLKTNSGNFLVSPITVETVIALIHAGASGKTAEQISTSLHFPESSDQVQQIFQELIPQLKSSKLYTLHTANKVYVKEGYQVNDHFKDVAVNVFDGEIQTIDFAKSEKSAAEMSKWVEDKTQEKIKNLVTKDDLDPDTVAVLINTLYFNGKWKHPFDGHLTSTKHFHVNKNEQVEVEMMKVDTFLNYFDNKDLKAQFVEMPYKGEDVTMTIVLPNEVDGLSTLEAHLDEVFKKPAYYLNHLNIELPKFKVESTIQFKPILQNLGMVDAFEDNADFRGILKNQPLKISKVIQKNFIEVHEEGTEASSAAGGFAQAYSVPQPFKADHPFIFYIKHKDVVLFAGRFVSPDV